MATVKEDRLTETANAVNVYYIDTCLFYGGNGKRVFYFFKLFTKKKWKKTLQKLWQGVLKISIENHV